MYHPKIRADLIPRLYRLAKVRGVPMTRLIAQLLETALEHVEQGGETVHDPPAPEYQRSAPFQEKGETDGTCHDGRE